MESNRSCDKQQHEFSSLYDPAPGGRQEQNLLLENDIYSAYGNFLSGKKLDVGRRFHDLSVPKIVDRLEYIHWRCKGKKVLHIGCLDHPEIILERVKDQTWLHGIVSRVAELCVGIDIDSSGCDLVWRELGIKNIQLLDLSKLLEESDLTELRKTQWDLILCPELLEHITNHQQFLQNLHNVSHSKTKLIVTVPNAFRFANFINALRGFESINSDHKYWFTFYTLSRMLTAGGWKPRQLIYYNYTGLKRWGWMDILSLIATRTSRVFCDGFIIEATRRG
jgi:predicted SAM-dependent methyltransferase